VRSVPLLWFANLQKTSLVTRAYKNVLPRLKQFTQMWLKVSENETDKNQTDTAARKMLCKAKCSFTFIHSNCWKAKEVKMN